jgi:hypothetical protein
MPRPARFPARCAATIKLTHYGSAVTTTMVQATPLQSYRDLCRRSRDPVQERQSRRGVATTAQDNERAEAHCTCRKLNPTDTDIELGDAPVLCESFCSLIWLALVGTFWSPASLEAENMILRHQLNACSRNLRNGRRSGRWTV